MTAARKMLDHDWQDPTILRAPFPKPQKRAGGRGYSGKDAVEATRKLMRKMGKPDYKPPDRATIDANRLPSGAIPFCFAMKTKETLKAERAARLKIIKREDKL